LLEKAVSQMPHNCSNCGLRGKSEDWCEYHDRKVLGKEDGCGSWNWEGYNTDVKKGGPFEGCTLKFDFTCNGKIYELKDCSKDLIERLMFEIDVILGKKKSSFNPYYDSTILVFVYVEEELIRGAGVYLIEFTHSDLEDIYRQASEAIEHRKE
jgi:hypothetical protein